MDIKRPTEVFSPLINYVNATRRSLLITARPTVFHRRDGITLRHRRIVSERYERNEVVMPPRGDGCGARYASARTTDRAHSFSRTSVTRKKKRSCKIVTSFSYPPIRPPIKYYNFIERTGTISRNARTAKITAQLVRG